MSGLQETELVVFELQVEEPIELQVCWVLYWQVIKFVRLVTFLLAQPDFLERILHFNE